MEIVTELEGKEKDISTKLGLSDLSGFWPLKFSGAVYLPQQGWCSLFRAGISKIKCRRVFGEIKYIDPQVRELRVSWWRKLKYKELINTLPLDYFLSKLRGMDNTERDLKTIPLYISSLLLRDGIDEIKMYYLGKRKYASIAIVHLPLLNQGSKNYSVAYVIIPYQSFREQGAFRERAISDAKRLGILKEEPLSVRGYFEKYGVLLGKPNKENHLKKHGIFLAGRLGRWRELGICELIREVKKRLS